ncbi:hypothetical protein [Breznakiella homolactica]|uniref:MotA/TolQ/ExbB proton channel domain-containing protein n=1 Tax=Breznakiella homolactica TaxID=2798577 RepID=A0A7T7XM43_9SPIR|nr:hypothetical protein [Breznakiella homolactica]QQO08758.1 hypothetical protein JFL75_17795 [Breznakiella homolactica]
MIFIGFLLISGIFLLYAWFSGNAGFFINPDSMPISPAAVLLFSVFSFRWKEFVRGLRTMFLFSLKKFEGSGGTARHYRSLIWVSLTAGLVSTAQGLFSYFLTVRDNPQAAVEISASTAFCYAGFSTVYGLMLSVFLLYPVYLLHREKSGTRD